MFTYYGLNRTVCDVLKEMRDLINSGRTRPDIMLSLIEEVQCMANRMEAALADVKQAEEMRDDIKSLKKQIKTLNKEKKNAEEDS